MTNNYCPCNLPLLTVIASSRRVMNSNVGRSCILAFDCDPHHTLAKHSCGDGAAGEGEEEQSSLLDVFGRQFSGPKAERVSSEKES